MIENIKRHHDYSKMGMIASHLGVVRETALNGKRIRNINVSFDKRLILKIASETKALPGIIEVLVDIAEGTLNIGEEIMAVVVGGDTREHVFPALISVVDRIKTEAGKKTEFF